MTASAEEMCEQLTLAIMVHLARVEIGLFYKRCNSYHLWCHCSQFFARFSCVFDAILIFTNHVITVSLKTVRQLFNWSCFVSKNALAVLFFDEAHKQKFELINYEQREISGVHITVQFGANFIAVPYCRPNLYRSTHN